MTRQIDQHSPVRSSVQVKLKQGLSRAQNAPGRGCLRTIFEDMREGCQIVDFQWRYLYVNGSAARQERHSRQELIGQRMMDVYPGFETTPVFAKLRECMELRSDCELENEVFYPDGTSAIFELSIQAVPEGILVFSTEITDRRRAQAELRRTDELLHAGVSGTTDSLFVKDREGRFLFVNEAAAKRVGLTPVELIGKDMTAFFEPEGARRIMQRDRQVME